MKPNKKERDYVDSALMETTPYSNSESPYEASERTWADVKDLLGTIISLRSDVDHVSETLDDDNRINIYWKKPRNKKRFTTFNLDNPAGKIEWSIYCG